MGVYAFARCPNLHANRNNINVFPHSTFNWVGIDGTQVLCHMTPVGTSPHTDLLQSAYSCNKRQIRTMHRRRPMTSKRRSPTIRYHRQPRPLLPLMITCPEPRVKFDVSSRFWKRRRRWWSIGQDVGECTAFTLPPERRSLMSAISWTAPSPPWHREYIARTAGCAYGSLRRRILRPSQDKLGCGPQAAKLVRDLR